MPRPSCCLRSLFLCWFLLPRRSVSTPFWTGRLPWSTRTRLTFLTELTGSRSRRRYRRRVGPARSCRATGTGRTTRRLQRTPRPTAACRWPKKADKCRPCDQAVPSERHHRSPLWSRERCLAGEGWTRSWRRRESASDADGPTRTRTALGTGRRGQCRCRGEIGPLTTVGCTLRGRHRRYRCPGHHDRHRGPCDGQRCRRRRTCTPSAAARSQPPRPPQ
mmetsp:Transcript_13661/g.42947  ORF Transcript_13661/g.42947 Transcript_13661/m.42947 type:complete len:219 (+) Transcript_13661:907-1563(+)